ncbi:MAG: protein kinase domain-containing protein [Planctomycetaceae bacterium]
MHEDQNSLYCVACNRCYAPVTQLTTCPRCQAELQTVPSFRFLDTLHYKTPASGSDTSLPTPHSSLIGTTLHVYECESLLGRGGMGTVYLARHLDLGRHCAVKVLDPQFTDIDDDYLERFMHEGRSAAAINHPHIITTHAIGEADGLFFLEMEFLIGGSLQQYLEAHGRFHPLRATEILTQIARGLSEAHRIGIVHRDLKLDNILLTRQGVPKIADFGLAKRLVAAIHDADARRIIGTPHYMAPELFTGESASKASDVYALGVCYFIMLTGRFPFLGNTLPQLVDSIQSAPLPNLREINEEIPLEFAECLHMLMSRSLKSRPQDANAALRLLEAVLGEHRDIESLLYEAFGEADGIKWNRTRQGMLLTLNMPERRQQQVMIEIQQNAPGEDTVKIYSICCEAQASFYEQALKLNAEILHGGLSIHQIEGKAMFVLLDTYPLSTIDALELHRSVMEAGRRADAIEKLLTGGDRY